MLWGRVLLTGAGCVFKVYTINRTYSSHFTRVCVRYGVRLGQPKQCILYVYACMWPYTVVGMCSPSFVSIVVSTCMHACTVVDIYGQSGVLVVQRVLGA